MYISSLGGSKEAKRWLPLKLVTHSSPEAACQPTQGQKSHQCQEAGATAERGEARGVALETAWLDPARPSVGTAPVPRYLELQAKEGYQVGT